GTHSESKGSLGVRADRLPRHPGRSRTISLRVRATPYGERHRGGRSFTSFRM
ncbi:MAG: hypothetical protein AVDCRST_MAG59-436, partial [uncultured Thermomicrobiales bacterium]